MLSGNEIIVKKHNKNPIGANQVYSVHTVEDKLQARHDSNKTLQIMFPGNLYCFCYRYYKSHMPYKVWSLKKFSHLYKLLFMETIDLSRVVYSKGKKTLCPT